MSKRTDKTTNSSHPSTAMIQTKTANLVEADKKHERPAEEAPPLPGTMKRPLSAPARPLPAAPAVPAEPLTPMGALRSGSVTPQWQSEPAQPATPQAQKTPATTPAPAAPPAPAALPPKSAAPAPAKWAVSPQTPKPVPAKTVDVKFSLVKPGAKRVSVCGDFNGWSHSAAPMKRHEDGHWDTTVGLAPGSHQYKFLVDEEWLPDPAAQKNVPNQYGSLNSVVEVRV